MNSPPISFIIAALAVAAAFLANKLYYSSLPTSLSPMVYDSAQDITYIGSVAGNVEHFQNVFYAEEPSGPLRFAPPVPIRHSKGALIDAKAPGAWCPQGLGDVLPFTSQVTNISENCLSLRIARSKSSNSEQKLPVVVYIHGGGHALGSAQEILYTPDGLIEEAAAAGKPLIYVGINYRLGLFGFATSKSMIEKKLTNAGLRDQRAALEWVRDNIEVFGGDPNQGMLIILARHRAQSNVVLVTAIGQSVGASDIGLHLVSFDGNQGVPFQQAMMMSGAPGLNFNSDPEKVADITADIAKQANCVPDGQDPQSLETLECLQSIPFETLANLSVTASRAARPPFGEGYLYPTIDGDILQGRPSELLRAGKVVPNIPVIGSWVTNDGAWYAPPTTATDDDVLSSFGLWLSRLSPETQKTLLELYPVEDFTHIKRHAEGGLPVSPQYYRAAQMNRDIWFTCPVLDFTWQYQKQHHNDGRGSSTAARVWLYEHNATRYSPVYEYMGVPMWGVAHLSDIPYVHNNQELSAGADNSLEQLELGRAMSRRVIDFAYYGSPGDNKWKAVFDEEELRSGADNPEKLCIQVFGGPYGGRFGETVSMSRDTEYTEQLSELEKAMVSEKLYSRCDFINSAQMRREAGV